MSKPEDVDSYISNSAEEARLKLRQMRETLRAAVPEAQESISWGVPFYRYHGALAGFAAYKKHVSFGLAVAIQPEDRNRLEEQGYRTGSKTVQIRFDQDVPAAEVTQMLRALARLNEAAAKP